MLFRIVDIPGKDKGVVCTEAVPRGTLLIAEELVVRYDNTKAGLSNFPTYFNSLSEEARASLLAFLPTAWNEDLLLSRINHFLPVDGPLDETHAGFFPFICRLNHSCDPSASYYWDAKLQRQMLHAVKDIAKGEEISVSYGSTDPEYLEDRFLWLQTNFAFDCGCPSHSATSIPPPLAFPSPLNSGSALPEEVLASLDTLLLAGCRAGLVAQVAISALQAAELCALWGDDDAGRAWARLAWGVSCLYKGRAASESVEAARLMEDPMKRWNWGLRGFEALPGPSEELKHFSFDPDGTVL